MGAPNCKSVVGMSQRLTPWTAATKTESWVGEAGFVGLLC